VQSVTELLGKLGAARHVWNDLQRRIDGLTSPAPGSALDAYDEATAGAKTSIVRAGDESNLILDPDLDSQYVMDAIIDNLPAMSDTIGRAGDRLIAHGGEADVDLRFELAIENGIVHAAAAATTAGLHTALEHTEDPALAAQLAGPLSRLNADRAARKRSMMPSSLRTRRKIAKQ